MSKATKCPLCAMTIDRQVFVGLFGKEIGPRYRCGSIYWPSQDRITIEGTACAQMQRMRAAIDAGLKFIDGCSDAGTPAAEDAQLRMRCALLTDPYRPGAREAKGEKMTEGKTPREVWIIFDDDGGGFEVAHVFRTKQTAFDAQARWIDKTGLSVPPPVRFVEEEE